MGRLFEQLKRDPDSRPGLTPLLTTLVTAHSRAEETTVYPAVHDEADSADDVEHSQEEHLLADKLLLELASCDPTSAGYEKKLAELVDAVTHHIEEEEDTVLKDLADALPEKRRAEFGADFLRSRESHLGDQAESITKKELEQQAANAGITVGDAGKSELQEKLRNHADK